MCVYGLQGEAALEFMESSVCQSVMPVRGCSEQTVKEAQDHFSYVMRQDHFMVKCALSMVSLLSGTYHPPARLDLGYNLTECFCPNNS